MDTLKEDWRLVVVHTGTKTWFEARDVRADIDRPEQFRDDLVEIAKSDSYLTTGSARDWIREFEGRVYSEREHRKGARPGGWGTPEKVLRFRD